MATKSSGQLALSASYTLGEYSFSITVEPVSGSTNHKVTAVCRHAGKVARKSGIFTGIPKSWSVEADEKTATVYVDTELPPLDLGSGVANPPPYSSAVVSDQTRNVSVDTCSGGMVTSWIIGPRSLQCFYISKTPGASGHTQITYRDGTQPAEENWPCNQQFTYDGKTVYYGVDGTTTTGGPLVSVSVSCCGPGSRPNIGAIAWTIAYGSSENAGKKTQVVGRFEIDLGDAGGEGPDSDWTDPGDHDDDRDPEDPTTTLYLTVRGALSGRHNDPLNDRTYSYLPKDNETKKDYGCGGDGGYGGGGGAGAANVVVFKFATNEADHKDITTIAKRHGYGSGGGKGGKGGSGCILIYY